MRQRNRGLELTFKTIDASRSAAAVDMIVRSLESRQVKVRRWAFARALASTDRSVHRAVIRHLDQMPEQVRSRLPELRGTMTAALRIALLGNDSLLRANAATLALEVGEYVLIPDLVRFLKDREKVDDTVASTVLELADRLREDLKVPRRKLESRELESVAEECREAVEPVLATFQKHRSRGLLEAYLILAGTGDARVRDAIAHPRSLLGAAIMGIFESGTSRGIRDLLADALLCPETPPVVSETLRRRKDVGFIRRVLQLLGTDRFDETVAAHPILGRMEFLHDPAFPFEELEDAAQSKLVRLIVHSDLPESRRIWLLEYFAINGGSLARAATVEALGLLSTDRAAGMIERLLYDPAPEVVAATVRQLRHHDVPGGIDLALELVGHPDARVRAAVHSVLGEADFIAFFSELPKLGEMERRRQGRLAMKADPKAILLLRRELSSLTRERRLRALEAVEAMGARDRVEDLLLEGLEDRDPAVRQKAAELLGERFAPVRLENGESDSASVESVGSNQ
jgi:hypothetical protein